MHDQEQRNTTEILWLESDAGFNYDFIEGSSPKERLGDTLEEMPRPSREGAKPYSREQTRANIETINSSVPLSYIN